MHCGGVEAQQWSCGVCAPAAGCRELPCSGWEKQPVAAQRSSRRRTSSSSHAAEAEAHDYPSTGCSIHMHVYPRDTRAAAGRTPAQFHTEDSKMMAGRGGRRARAPRTDPGRAAAGTHNLALQRPRSSHTRTHTAQARAHSTHGTAATLERTAEYSYCRRLR